MTDDIRYGQKKIHSVDGDGMTHIHTEGYFDGLRSVKEQIREDIQTTQATLLTDVIRCLDVLKTDSPELVITIKKDRVGSINLIQKLWVVKVDKIK